MSKLYLNNPDVRISGKLQDAALLLLRFGIHLEGITDLVAWRIYPTREAVATQEIRISVMENGVWQPLGSFYLHEMSMSAVAQYLDEQIDRVNQRRKERYP